MGVRPRAIPAVIHHLGKADGDADRAKQTAYFQIAQEEAAHLLDDFRAQFNLMQEAAMLEAWSACADATRACLRLEADPPLRLRLSGARAFNATGHHQEALELLDRPSGSEALPALLTVKGEVLDAIDRQPTFTLSFLRLARLLRAQGDQANARAILEAGLDQNPTGASCSGRPCTILQSMINDLSLSQTQRSWDEDTDQSRPRHDQCVGGTPEEGRGEA